MATSPSITFMAITARSLRRSPPAVSAAASVTVAVVFFLLFCFVSECSGCSFWSFFGQRLWSSSVLAIIKARRSFFCLWELSRLRIFRVILTVFAARLLWKIFFRTTTGAPRHDWILSCKQWSKKNNCQAFSKGYPCPVRGWVCFQPSQGQAPWPPAQLARPGKATLRPGWAAAPLEQLGNPRPKAQIFRKNESPVMKSCPVS